MEKEIKNQVNIPPARSIQILIVDDEKAARYGMVKALKPVGYKIWEAEDAFEALSLMAAHDFKIVITDVAMPKMNGIELLTKIKETNSQIVVIVITAHGSERIAVEAMKAGAFDYIAKPYDIDELRVIVRNAAHQVGLFRENTRLLQELNTAKGYGTFIGDSPAMRKIYQLVDKVSTRDVTMLIRGESGTGKELVAHTIHEKSKRAEYPFVSINCAAIPGELIESELFGHERGAFTGAIKTKEGKFELAHCGTIFLDEIGDMSLETQAKVLRVLQEKKIERVGGKNSIDVDVRIISATHKDLQEEIKRGNFREDLYFRLNVVEIMLPPLRERRGDVVLLANHFLRVFSSKHDQNAQTFTPEAVEILMEYTWPGNVRELMNVVERCVVLSDGGHITRDMLPTLRASQDSAVDVRSMIENGDMTFQEAKNRVTRTFERNFLTEAIKMNQGNISQTAVLLGMKRQYLQQKLKDLGIDAKEIKESLDA